MPQRHHAELTESVMAEPLIGSRRTPRTFDADRVCRAPGCRTRLSIYNSGAFCASHNAHRVWKTSRITPQDEVGATEGAPGRGRAGRVGDVGLMVQAATGTTGRQRSA